MAASVALQCLLHLLGIAVVGSEKILANQKNNYARLLKSLTNRMCPINARLKLTVVPESNYVAPAEHTKVILQLGSELSVTMGVREEYLNRSVGFGGR